MGVLVSVVWEVGRFGLRFFWIDFGDVVSLLGQEEGVQFFQVVIFFKEGELIVVVVFIVVLVVVVVVGYQLGCVLWSKKELWVVCGQGGGGDRIFEVMVLWWVRVYKGQVVFWLWV